MPTLETDTEALSIATVLKKMRVLGLDKDDRCQMLAHCRSFYLGTQHDHLTMDWSAKPRTKGVTYMQERLRSEGFVPIDAATYADRKPDAPVPLGRQVVNRFTEMLLGQGRSPTICTYSDESTAKYLNAAFDYAELWDVLCEARDLAGACGSAALAISLYSGKLAAEVLDPAHLWVAEWDESDPGWVPKIVVEQRKVRKQIQDENGRLKTIDAWRTRAWTAEYSILYEDHIETGDEEKEKAGIKIRAATKHEIGRCPVVWYQNTRSNTSPDGQPDCDGVWPLLDKLDRLQSQVYKAAISNADPTIVLKDERRGRLRGRVIRKGSTHAIDLSPQGDAKFLEISGNTIEIGLRSISEMTEQVLQTVECVVMHAENAKAYQSGEALQILWRSMESKANRLRTQLGGVVRDLCDLLLRMAAAHGVGNAEDPKAKGILLPPVREVEEMEEPPGGVMPGEEKPEPIVRRVAHEAGPVETCVTLEWPPYWTPTANQIAQMAAAMASATTSKQTLSSETATRSLAQMLGIDGDEEFERLEEEKEQGMAQLLGSMGDEDEEGEGEGDQPEGSPPGEENSGEGGGESGEGEPPASQAAE